MQINTDELIEYLIATHNLDPEEVREILGEVKGLASFDVLTQKNILTEQQLQEAKAHFLGIPFVDLEEEGIDTQVLSRIPEPLARKHGLVAYREKNGTLEVAMLDPSNLLVIDSLRKTLGVKVTPRLATHAAIQDGLNQYRQSLQAEFSDIIDTEASAVATDNVSLEGSDDPEDLKKMAEDVPIIKIVDTLIAHAFLQNASDIHIEPEEEALLVRYRIDGILHDVMTLPRNVAPGVVARIKVLSNLRIDEKRLPQDGRFKIDKEGQHASFRVSTLPTYFGEKVVIRLLRDNAQGLSLETLGFHGHALEHIHGAMKQKTGMILISGPTGSGKTTTLYTMLDLLNTPDVNISTVEDPIEYQVHRINQTQVRSDIGLSFSSGLRALLRQDPDIIMVGEIRDKETVTLAVNASLTGHLVLSTIHTNSASGVIPRMIDMGIEPFLIASTLKTVTAQRLVRRLCEEKEEYFLDKEERAQLDELVDMDRILKFLKEEKVVDQKATWDTIPFYRAKPNNDCETGYSGRVSIQEVLPVTDSLKEVIMKGGSADEIEAHAKELGMMTMIEDGIFKAAQGVTTTAEVLRVVSE